jgi:hypothetical protein
MRESSENIMRAIDLSRQLLYCADLGALLCEDKHCGVFYRIIRDSANKILNAAEQERTRHMNRGIWDNDGTVASGPAIAEDKK